MQLEWIEANPTDSDGERYLVHYLIDTLSDQCMATIAEPSKGHILYQTDLKIRGYDRCFISLSAAKSYCECAAIQANLEDAKEMSKQFDQEAVKEKVAE